MKDVYTYTNNMSTGLDFPWDFVNNPYDDTQNQDIWDISPNVNNGYPYLSALAPAFFEDNTLEQAKTYHLTNYPNPFNPETTISYQIKNPAKVEITVYNIKGQKVRTLVNEKKRNGLYKVIWNGKDNKNKTVASGVYLYKLNVNGKTVAVKKFLLLK